MRAAFLLTGAIAAGAVGWNLLWLALLLVAGSAFFSGSETAVVSASRARLQRQSDEGRPDARAAVRLLADTPRTIAATLVGTNICNVGAASLVTAIALGRWPEHGPTVATIVLTPIALFVGEILPKALYRSRPTRLLRGSAGALLFFRALLSPVVSLTSFATTGILLLLRVPRAERRPVFGRQDLETVFLYGGVREEEGERDGTRETLRMAGRVLELVRRRVTEAMVPLPERRSCPETSTVGEAVEKFRASRGRFLAVRDAGGDVVGIVAAKQLLGVAPEEPLRPHVRPAYPLRPEDSLDRAITGLRRSRLPVAVVRDAAGRPLGVVAPEDLLEEIVGELPAAPPPAPAARPGGRQRPEPKD